MKKEIIYLLIIFILIIFIFYNNFSNNLNNKIKTYIKESKYGGKLSRGVFANCFIKKGEIIEEHYLLLDTFDNLFCGIYKDYVYTLTGKDDDALGFPLGNGGLYNHSLNNNAIFRSNKDKFKTIAIKDINKNEEIFTCYGCNHPESTDNEDYMSTRGINYN